MVSLFARKTSSLGDDRDTSTLELVGDTSSKGLDDPILAGYDLCVVGGDSSLYMDTISSAFAHFVEEVGRVE